MIHPDVHCSIYDAMEDYAWLLITATLCTMWREGSEIYDDNKVNFSSCKIRYYTTALLEISRKNHKTFYCAVIIILLMLTGVGFGRYFSVAPTLAQSSEVKLAVRKILKSSPLLMDEEDPAFKILRSEVTCNINESDFTPLAYSNDNLIPDWRMHSLLMKLVEWIRIRWKQCDHLRLRSLTILEWS